MSNTLYKRTSAGAIQQWTIQVEQGCYRTISGQLNGKLVTSSWTQCEGKNLGKTNETTPTQQALSEAESRTKFKLKEGYVDDLNDVGDKAKFVVALCKEYKDYKNKITFPCYTQPKLDGIRNNVSEGRGMETRGYKQTMSCPHIYKVLSQLFVHFPDIIIDGELYNHKLKNNFNKLTSLIGTQKPSQEHLNKTEVLVKFYVFDILLEGERSMHLTFSERWDNVKSIIEGIHKCIEIVPTIKCNNHEEIDAAYKMYRDMGYEGQIIRMDVGYKEDYSSNILKRKDFVDEEFELLGFEEGKGKMKGIAAKANFIHPNGKVFNTGILGKLDYCKMLFENQDKFIGMPVTVKYQDLTSNDGNGVPRFGKMKAIRDYE